MVGCRDYAGTVLARSPNTMLRLSVWKSLEQVTIVGIRQATSIDAPSHRGERPAADNDLGASDISIAAATSELGGPVRGVLLGRGSRPSTVVPHSQISLEWRHRQTSRIMRRSSHGETSPQGRSSGLGIRRVLSHAAAQSLPGQPMHPGGRGQKQRTRDRAWDVAWTQRSTTSASIRFDERCRCLLSRDRRAGLRAGRRELSATTVRVVG